MSEELKDITKNVMNQIHQGKAKMKPRIYFIIGSILTFLGLISSMIVSVFFVGLIRFSLRAHGPMGEYRFEQMITNFPWWAAAFAVFGLVLGIWFIRKYDFSYKKNSWMIIAGFVLAVLVAGYIFDALGLNMAMSRFGPMKGMINNSFQENRFK